MASSQRHYVRLRVKDLIKALRKVDGEAPVHLDESLGTLLSLEGVIVRQYTNPDGEPIVILELDLEATIPLVYEESNGHKVLRWNG
jgi:hypothetical protein